MITKTALWGAHAPSRAEFGALAELLSQGLTNMVIKIAIRCTAADQEARNRCSIFGERLVWVAVEPAFARLRRCDHRMSTGMCMFTGVLIWRAVAAQRDSTRLARPEMHPV